MSTEIISALVRDRAPFFTQLNADDSETMYAMDSPAAEVAWKSTATCQHSETMCQDCWSQWAQDHDVLTFTIMDDTGVHTINMQALTAQLRTEMGDQS